jgi:DNA-binding LytR/AlgR family response regulator
MIKCIAIDDEPIALDILRAFADRTGEVELLEVFTKPSLASRFLEQNDVDLIFLDIQMPDITGIDFYKALRQKTMVVFTTAYDQYAVQGFDLQALDYLLKPFTLARFQLAVEKAIDYKDFRMSKAASECLFVYSEYALIQIRFHEIVYIEGVSDYIKIHLIGKKPVMTLMTLKTVLEKLPTDRFVRIHRSFIVSLSAIQSVRGKLVFIDQKELPIGDVYRDNIKNRF